MQDTIESVLEPLESAAHDGAVDFLDLLLVLTRARKRIACTIGAAAFAAAIVALLLPSYYKGKTTLLPPQSNQQTTNLLAGQLTALAGLSPRDLGIKNQNDLYVGLLKSETVANELIQRFRLQQVYGKHRLVDARTRLAKLSDINSGKDGLITITVEDRDPKRAAALANGYVEQLQQLSQQLALTEAGQRRLFFEQQIRKCKEDLDAAQVALSQTQQHTGIIELEANAKVLLEQIGILRGELAAKEAEVQSMQAFAAKDNPDLRFAEEQASALRTQLAKLERGPGEGNGESTGKLSAGAVEYARKWRDVKYQQTLFELLSSQYEAARLDEAKEGTVFQVVDRAAPPEKRSSPPRLLIVAAATVFFGVLAVVGSVLQDARRRSHCDPGRVGKLLELRNSWRLPVLAATRPSSK